MAKYKYEVSVTLDLTDVQNPGVYKFDLQERYSYAGRVYVSDIWHQIFVGNTYISIDDIDRGEKTIYITDLISSRKWDGLEYTTTSGYKEEVPTDESCVVPLYNEYRVVLTINLLNIITSTVANVQFLYRYHNGSTNMIPNVITTTLGYGDIINPLLQGNRIISSSRFDETSLIPRIPYLLSPDRSNFNWILAFNWNNSSENETYYINFHGLISPTINKQAIGITTAFPTFCHKLNMGTLYDDTQYNPEGSTREESLPIVPFNQGSWTYWTYDVRRNCYFLPNTWSTSYNLTFNFIINMTSGLNITEYDKVWNPNNLGAVYQLNQSDIQTIKDAIAQGDSIQYFTIEVSSVVDGEGNIARMKMDIDTTNPKVLEDVGKYIENWKFYPQQYGMIDANYKFTFESTIEVPFVGPTWIDLNGHKLAYIDVCPANYYIVWQDRGGSYQCQPFSKTETYSESFKRNTWNRWDGEERYSSIDVQPKWKLNSGWVDESLMPYYESLYVSNNIQLWDIKNSEVIDCVLKDNNFTEKTFKNQGRKMFNIEVELVESKIQNIIY